MPTTFPHLLDPRIHLCALGPLLAAHHPPFLCPSLVRWYSNGDWSRGGVLVVVGESGYVQPGGSVLLGNKSERARMRRLGRLLISLSLKSPGRDS